MNIHEGKHVHFVGQNCIICMVILYFCIPGYWENVHRDTDKCILLHVPEYHTVVQSRKLHIESKHTCMTEASCPRISHSCSVT